MSSAPPAGKAPACRHSGGGVGLKALLSTAAVLCFTLLCLALVILHSAALSAQAALPSRGYRRELRMPAEPELVSGAASQRGADAALPTPAARPSVPPLPSVDKYHVICASGGGIYEEWQSRVSHYWYQRVKEACEAELGPRCPMGGYTRLLHSGKGDEWMEEIHTVVVAPVPPGLEELGAEYEPLQRPYAYKQWVAEYIDTIPESYIWMGDPDHLFLRAPPLWATPESPAGFPFWYMTYEDERKKAVIDRYNPKRLPLDKFAGVGPAPLQIHKRQFAALADPWFNLTLTFLRDPEALGAFGWIVEMYSYTIAAATSLDTPIMHTVHPEIQIQPPEDADYISNDGLFYDMIHFTYANRCTAKGECTEPDDKDPKKWRWHKRDWENSYPPRDYPLPPGCLNPVVKELVRRMNEAADNLPGWDERAGQLPAELAAEFGQPAEQPAEQPLEQ